MQLILGPRLRRLRLASAALMYGAILIMGSIPGARAELGNVASGIVLHSVAYGALTFLLFTGLLGTARERAVRAVLTVALMGALDELVQSFLPYRVGSAVDWIVDSSAALVVATLLWRYLPEPLPAPVT